MFKISETGFGFLRPSEGEARPQSLVIRGAVNTEIRAYIALEETQARHGLMLLLTEVKLDSSNETKSTRC